ncbi:hypothetical protein B7494_g5036 [Chlorociboria aeruginascens]|nr:hypothetical protein B7494_g5036 [Chlorociboria aeruginascens]
MDYNYGRRLMPTVLRSEAKHNPTRVFALAAKSDNVDDGFREVTFQQVAQATNYTSHWLQKRFENGNKPPKLVTLAYIGVPDLRYNILFYAAAQCRYKVFLTSPRNPTAVNTSLLEQTECSRLVYSVEVNPVAKSLKAALPELQCEEFPSLDELLAAPATEYGYDLTYEDVYNEPLLILHSSGSTGMPKPVVNKHGTFATLDIRDWPVVPGRLNHDVSTLRFPQPNSRIYDVFPPFHVVGFLLKVINPLYNLTAPIFGPPLRPPSGALAAEIIRLYKPRGAIIPPSITEQLYHEPDSLNIFRSLDLLLFAGGPLPQKIGDEISKYTNLGQFYGSTEMGQIRQLIPEPEDWPYMEFHPNEAIELQPIGDDLFELVVISDKSLERSSSLYHNYPDLKEWRTKDLFKQHPTKPGLWKFHARRDDILVFSSGEKLNPLPMETSVTAIPGVGGALVVGQGHPQAGLLVELRQNAQFSSDPRQDLWPAIENANAFLPGHGRIARSMIIIAKPEKPFARAGKGTVIRRVTEQLYAAEIQTLYETASSTPRRAPIALKASVFRSDDIKGLIRSILSEISVHDQLGDDDNFYVYGMDSVKTAEAVGHLKASLLSYKSESDLNWISGELFYRNPTIQQLSPIILEFLNHGSKPKRRDRVAELQAKIAEYTGNLPPKPTTLQSKANEKRFSVAITGTTGYLGGYLLTELTKIPDISRIFCLNRSPKARQIFEEHNPGNTKDLVFLHVNLASHNLGLSDDDYAQLLQDCDVILHNAWRVDFNLSLSSFEDNLQSVKHFINLSAASPIRPRIIFISSISSTGVSSAAGSPRLTIPEDIVTDLGVTMDMGYGESKHVAEHILYAATKHSGVPATIIRMGQISPSSIPEEVRWPGDDLVPVFLQTSKALGMLASDFVETVDWVPVNAATAVVSDIVQYEIHNRGASSIQFYNVVHPKAHPWSAMMEVVQTWCGEGTQTINMQQWVQKLQALDTSDLKTLERLPALRMIPSYEGIATSGPTHEYAMERLMAVSKSMAKLVPVDAQLMEMWLQRL